MSKRKGGDDADESNVQRQLSRLDLSGVKRKPGDDQEEKKQRKAIRQAESPYEAMRRELILANPAAALEVPSLLDAKKHSFLDHVIIMINMNDEGGLMKILDQEKLEPAMAASVFRAVVRNNLLAVIVMVITIYPQVDLEEAVQDGIRYPSCKVPTMKLLLTLWADEHGETVEEAAKQMLDKAGKDSAILDPARLRALREMAGMPERGLDEEPEKLAVLPRDEETKEIQLAPVPVETKRPDYSARVGDLNHKPGAVFTPNGKYVLYHARGYEVSLEVFDVDALETVKSIELKDRYPVYCLAAGQDNKTAYVASYNQIQICDLDEGKVVRKIEVAPIAHDHIQGIQAMTLSPDDKYLAVGDGRGRVYILDIGTGLSVRDLSAPSLATVALRYSFDGAVLVWNAKDGRAAMWDTQTGQRYTEPPLLDVSDIAASPVEPLLAILSRDGSVVKLWDIATRKAIRIFRLPGGKVSTVSFSPHGTKLVLGGEWCVIVDIATADIIHASSHGRFYPDSTAVSPVDYRVMAHTASFGRRFFFNDFRGGRAVKALRESIASGLANSAQPQSAFEQFLSRGLYDPRLFLGIAAFVTDI